jgi:hypothetical protein
MPLRRLPDPVNTESWKWRRPTCYHPEHNPPGLVHLKPGRYEWTCPGCGQVTIFTVPNVTYDVPFWHCYPETTIIDNTWAGSWWAR